MDIFVDDSVGAFVGAFVEILRSGIVGTIAKIYDDGRVKVYAYFDNKVRKHIYLADELALYTFEPSYIGARNLYITALKAGISDVGMADLKIVVNPNRDDYPKSSYPKLSNKSECIQELYKILIDTKISARQRKMRIRAIGAYIRDVYGHEGLVAACYINYDCNRGSIESFLEETPCSLLTRAFNKIGEFRQ
jgi:hypothetical protein